VTGELLPDKRTFVIPGRAPAFELPEGHGARLVHGPREYVELSLPGGESSLFVLARLAEEDECVMLHLGAQITSTAPRAFARGGHPSPLGYPFSSE
jgi:hypothetical protein